VYIHLYASSTSKSLPASAGSCHWPLADLLPVRSPILPRAPAAPSTRRYGRSGVRRCAGLGSVAPETGLPWSRVRRKLRL